MSYCLNDFEICSNYDADYLKAKNKKDSQYYFLKKYKNKKIEKENLEILTKKMQDISVITNLKFIGLFEEDIKERKDLYLIFELFNGFLVHGNNSFYNYEIWIIAQKLLEVFEKLSKEGIKFNKLNNIDVFEISLSEIKVNIFDVINDNLDNNNENNEILFNIGVIIEKMNKNDYYIKGLIDDLKNNRIDILTAKNIFNIFLRYSLILDKINSEVINYKGMIYSGSLKNGEPDGKGLLVNEMGLFYLGEFKDGKINGKGKYYIYKEKNEIKNKHVSQNLNDIINEKWGCKYENSNFIKSSEGIFYLNEIRNGKYLEYDSDNHKIFEGEFKDGKRNGFGIEYSDNHKIFEGYFQDDQRNGKGIEFYCFDSHYKKYEGDFKEGKRNGFGVLYDSNAGIKIYEGNFKNDLENGDGKLFYANGSIQYSGNFKDGFFYEKGTYYEPSDILGKITNVTNGLPSNKKDFNIYYYSGNIHYTISIENGFITDGKEYSENNRLVYTGGLQLISIDEAKKKLEINRNNQIKYYIFLLRAGIGIEYEYGKKKYEGGFLDGCYHGKGILYSCDWGSKHIKKCEGQFENNLFINGTKYKDNGEVEFQGTFKYGRLFTGYSNNNDYVGWLVDGKKDGKGKIYINGQLRFEGKFKNDKFVEGIVYNKNNEKYFEGTINDQNIKKGKFFCGYNIYEGQFEDILNIIDYIIDFRNTCEIIFEGEYRNGMKCGKGKDYITGYEGEYLYDMYYGRGYKNGKKTGIWEGCNYKNGLKNGEAKENSWTYYYVNGLKHGKGKKDNKIKNYIFGEETNIFNLRIENNCIYFNNIKEYEGDLVKGVKEGNGIEFYKNNNKRYEGSFKNGKHNGFGKEYYENGKILYIGTFLDDMYDGKNGIEYDEDGNILYEGEFKNGKYHGNGKLYRNGKIIYEGDFVENKLQGKGTEYNKEGNILYTGEFFNNTYNGYGSRVLIDPYEGYWTDGRPNKLKQGLYSLFLKLTN